MKLVHIFSDQVEIRSGSNLEPALAYGLNIADLPFEPAENSYYLINVHCIIGKTDKAQNQSGVTIYRHLLQRFHRNQDKLRVIFYSPLPQNILVDLMPGNFVLTLLPFIQSKFDGLFLDAFIQTVQTLGDSWPRFNNASENLLSGWALLRDKYGDSKIPLGGDLLVVDDEFADWANTYLTIFDDPDKVRFPPYGSQQEFRHAWKQDQGLGFVSDGASAADYVLSDLYLEENHELTKPFKTKSEIEAISGFKLFDEIKKRYPYLPYTMFTTSNKVWNQEAFRAEGVWGWAIKDSSTDLSDADKVAQFEYFQQCVSRMTEPEWRHAARIWKDLLKFVTQSDLNRCWWYDVLPDCLDVLRRCLTIIESVYSQRALFESTKIADFSGRQCAQVVNTLGGICETLQITEGRFCFLCGRTQTKSVGAYIFMLRSFYSHELFFSAAQPLEALFCIDLLLKLLMLSHAEFHDQPSERMVRDPKFVSHSNVNFFLQFDDLTTRNSEIRYDLDLLTDLKASFADVTEGLVSGRFYRDLRDRSRVLNLIESHTESAGGSG